jgi:hypothetical protein
MRHPSQRAAAHTRFDLPPFRSRRVRADGYGRAAQGRRHQAAARTGAGFQQPGHRRRHRAPRGTPQESPARHGVVASPLPGGRGSSPCRGTDTGSGRRRNPSRPHHPMTGFCCSTVERSALNRQAPVRIRPDASLFNCSKAKSRPTPHALPWLSDGAVGSRPRRARSHPAGHTVLRARASATSRRASAVRVLSCAVHAPRIRGASAAHPRRTVSASSASPPPGIPSAASARRLHRRAGRPRAAAPCRRRGRTCPLGRQRDLVCRCQARKTPLSSHVRIHGGSVSPGVTWVNTDL